MSDQKLHTALIDRIYICTLQEYFRMKGITEYKTLHNNHGELTKYESQFNKKLTRRDAIMISPLTQDEIDTVIKTCDKNEELKAYQKERNRLRLKYYEENYGSDD